MGRAKQRNDVAVENTDRRAHMPTYWFGGGILVIAVAAVIRLSTIEHGCGSMSHRTDLHCCPAVLSVPLR
jgi:hypothetical protein